MSFTGGARAAHRSAVAGALATRDDLSGFEIINLDGAFAGIARAVDGGFPFGEVSTQLSASGLPIRTVGAVRYQPLKVEFDSGMSAAWYQWIGSVTNPALAAARRAGEVLSATAQSTVRGRLTFRDALIGEVTFPGLDASSRDSIPLTVTIQPGSTQYDARTGSIALPTTIQSAKRWLTSSFRVRISGLASLDRAVQSVEPITFRPRIVVSTGRSAAGVDRVAAGVDGVDISNLTMRVSATQAPAFYKWFDDFMRDRNPQRMREGSIEVLNSTSGQSIAAVHFERLGIIRVVPMRTTTSATSTIEVEMFCDGGTTLDLSKLA